MDTIRINITAGSGPAARAIELEIGHNGQNNALSAAMDRTIERSQRHGHTKIFADGSRAPGDDTRTDHVALIDHTTGLMWAVESLGNPADAGKGQPHEKCAQRCAELRLLGHDDWRLPTHGELSALVDVTRRDPAIDINLFPRVLPRWHWTSTPLVNSDGTASASVAWYVDFSDGNVSYLRSSNGFALAVRRSGQ